MRASLVLTTYNWPDALQLVLTSALEQSVLPDEVLVADDGSTAPTADVVRAFATRFAERGVPLRHVWHPDEGFRAAAIRNRALAQASGEYVLLIDGDCVLHRDFVRSHLAFARSGQFVQGTRVLLDAERARRALVAGETRFGAFERGITNRMNALSLRWLSPLVPTPSDPLKGVRSCNMGFWLADARRVNGFNERFVGWGREDSEFVVRLVNAGVRRRKLKFGGIVYHLWHPERPRDALDANDELLASVRSAGSVWAEVGMSKYSEERPSE
ncbi:MAG: glycosyltransferase family 2 protein [Gemmatimonadaceae bacterium]|nr:glycosyltransferase family 2 protein [Gemmatimonadaceae bacterium]NUO95117.1 glycosyltransferase family 2 protein [Gemmatimonadaceae bacterium]NUP56871.1 glycosyltransferase family 2 protein [Gemmatimonadaceae bacterium]NUP70535.1 glycosyltransferase family 2 protein [Gemmatimonadaceae bacterium]NUR35548.1 glycosyltransferase family 2 protein [Gemmatimonadaceae bacterium]